MTWRSDATCPLIIYPGVDKQLVNWRFQNALGAEWSLLGGTPPARVTSNFKFSPAALKYQPIVDNSYTEQTKTMAATPGWAVTGQLEPWYVYYWLRVDSQTGNPTFGVKLQSQTAAHAVVDNFTAQTKVVGTDIPVDGAYHFYRAGPFPPTTYTTVAELLARLGFMTTATVVAYLGAVYVGHALDFQDNDNEPAWMVEPYEFDSRMAVSRNDTTSGDQKSTVKSQMVQFGRFKTSELGITFRNSWRTWWNYVSPGSTPWFSVFRNQQDWNREAETNAVPGQSHEGIVAKPRSKGYYGEMAWTAEPFDTFTGPAETVVVKVGGMISGITDVYFVSAPVTGIPGSNTYPYLDPDKSALSEQTVDDLASLTTFSQYQFGLLDHNSEVIALIAANKRSMFQFPVTVYSGDGSLDFSTFRTIFAGYISSPDQSGMGVDLQGLVFTVTATPILERLKQPIEVPTGRLMLKDALNSTAGGRYRCHKVAGIIQSPVNYLASTAPDESSFEAGSDSAVAAGASDAAPQGWTAAGTNYMIKKPNSSGAHPFSAKVCRNNRLDTFDEWQEISRTYIRNKLGRTYQIIFGLNSYMPLNFVGDYDPQFCEVIAEGLDAGGSVVSGETKSSGIIAQPPNRILMFPANGLAAPVYYWTRFSFGYSPQSSAVKKIRVRVRSNNYNANPPAIFNPVEIDVVQLLNCNMLQLEREAVGYSEFTDYGDESGLVSIGARGLYGSLLGSHGVDAEAFKFISMQGHPLDVMRRLILTTLRNEVGDWVSGTTYLPRRMDPTNTIPIGADSVTYSGQEWRCLRSTASVSATPPAEGYYWSLVSDYDAGDGVGLGELIPDSFINHAVWNSERNWKSGASPTEFSGYDFSKYVFDLRVYAKIDNLLQLLIDEFLRPLYANLYIDDKGQLCIRMNRENETAGSAWDNAATYVAGDCVTSASLSWRCILGHGPSQAPAEGTYWTSNSLGNADIDNQKKFFNFTFNLDKVVTDVVFQADYDISGQVDVEANKTAGGTKYLTEITFNERYFGHDDDDATTRAIDLYGRRTLEISSQAIRGMASTRFGISSNLGGDQIMRETARRILRRRHPHQIYASVTTADLSKRGLPMAFPIQVDSDAMINLYGAAGTYRRRVAATMQIARRLVEWNQGRITFDLDACADYGAIPNTHVAGALTAPTSNEFAIYIRNVVSSLYPELYNISADYEKTGMGYKQMPLWPKGAANVVWVSLYPGAVSLRTFPLSPPTAPSPTDYWATRIYAANLLIRYRAWVSGGIGGAAWAVDDIVSNAGKFWRCKVSNTSAVAPAENATWTEDVPTSSQYQRVQEIPIGGTEGYFLAHACAQVPTTVGGWIWLQRCWVRLVYVNLDYAETARSGFLSLTLPSTPVQMGSRMQQNEIKQYATDGAIPARSTFNGNRF